MPSFCILLFSTFFCIMVCCLMAAVIVGIVLLINEMIKAFKKGKFKDFFD